MVTTLRRSQQARDRIPRHHPATRSQRPALKRVFRAKDTRINNCILITPDRAIDKGRSTRFSYWCGCPKCQPVYLMNAQSAHDIGDVIRHLRGNFGKAEEMPEWAG
jgi:hypothetical protein